MHVTDTRSAPTWARNWKAQTKDGARALGLYDDATIKHIIEVLPSFEESAVQDVAKGLLRQWASAATHQADENACTVPET